MPPWELPANKTQSGIQTAVQPQGRRPANHNEIRFEDKKGSEQLHIHAEKNQDIEVENDETHWVGHDRKKTIDHDETTLVKHDRTETVNNNETITIDGDRKETVHKTETIIIDGDRTETVALERKDHDRQEPDGDGRPRTRRSRSPGTGPRRCRRTSRSRSPAARR